MAIKKTYIVRVVNVSGYIEVHEYENKKKALQERDDFRKQETVQTAKMFLKDSDRYGG